MRASIDFFLFNRQLSILVHSWFLRASEAAPFSSLPKSADSAVDEFGRVNFRSIEK